MENEDKKMMGDRDMEEIIAKLETLFEENPKYNIEDLKKYLNRTGELAIFVAQLKDEIMAENPEISHEDLIEKASMRVAEMVEKQEMTTEQTDKEER